MRHRKHNHLLGVKTAHRTSLIANLSCSLIENGRIKTTLAKARALRPAIEKAITLAKKAHASDEASKKVHYRRQAIARLRSKSSVKKLFDELVEQFVGRNGGYTRIYKLAIPRLGDAADMAIIEFVEVLQKKKSKKKTSPKKQTNKDSDDTKKDASSSVSAPEEKSEKKVESKESKTPSKKKTDAKDTEKKTDAKDTEKKTDAKDTEKKTDAKDTD
jgi:large subunit ribosomal protein L17